MLVSFADVQALEIEGVPFFKQERHKCGPASLASVLAYYGAQVDEEDIIKETYTESLKGSLISDLENYAKKKGYVTASGQGTTDTLKEAVLANRPIIVLIDLGVWRVAKPHYIVVFGYTEDGFIAHDGRKAATRFKYKKFQKAWGKMGCPYLILHP